MIIRVLALSIIALVLACGEAFAFVGDPPNPNSGPSLIDGAWLNGLAGGQNFSWKASISAAGTDRATATQIVPGFMLVEVDTVAASTGVRLPAAVPGTQVSIYNNGANTLSIYGYLAADTINGGSSLSGGVISGGSIVCSSAKSGAWSCNGAVAASASSITSGVTACNGCAVGGVAYNASNGKLTASSGLTYDGATTFLLNGNQVATTNQLATLPLSPTNGGTGVNNGAVTATFPTTSFTAARIDAAQTFTGGQTFHDGVVMLGTAGGSLLAIEMPLVIDKSASSVHRFSLFVGDGTGGTVADDNYINNLNTTLHIWGGASGTTDIANISTAGIALQTGVISSTAGSAGVPAYTSLTDTETGFFFGAANLIEVSVTGSLRAFFNATGLASNTSGGPVLKYAAGSATVPSFSPNGGDLTTGIGGVSGTLALIVGGASAASLTTTVLTLNTTTYASCTALTTNSSGVVGCTASASRFKDLLASAELNIAGLDDLRTDRPWTYRDGLNLDDRVHVGLLADDVERMDQRCVVYKPDGQLGDYEDRCLIAYLVADHKVLRNRIQALERVR